MSYITVRYTYHEKGNNFTKARSDCQTRGGDILSTPITGNSVLARIIDHTWVGIKRTDDVWKWPNGTIVSHNQWKDGRVPRESIYDKEKVKCAIHYLVVKWLESSCDMDQPYVCEYASEIL